jgi:fatty acid desaturase
VLIALTVHSPWMMVLFYLVPYVTSYPALMYLSDEFDHGGLDSEDAWDGSRNHLFVSSRVAWVLFPRNDRYHAVHHVFPHAPIAALSELYQLLAAERIP